MSEQLPGMLGMPSFDMSEDEKKQAMNMGLLAAGAGILAGNRGNYGRAGPAIGQGLLAGMQTYQGMNQQMRHDKRQAHSDQTALMRMQREQEQEAARKAAVAKLPPEMQGWAGAGVSMDQLFKASNPNSEGGDSGLVPQIGINPQTKKMGYFIQNKRGHTTWLDAEVPPDYTIIPGNEYQPTRAINRREPFAAQTVQPIGYRPSAQGAAPMPGPFAGQPAEQMIPTQSPQAAPMADPRAPWRTLPPKQADDMRSRVYEQSRKRLDAMSEEVTRGDSMRRDLERFGELNVEQGTGGLMDRISFLPTLDEQKREMEAISARLAPSMRPPGSGTTSDRDLSLYLQGLPGVDKPGPVNKNIREGYIKQFDAGKRKQAVYERYFQQFGHLDGAEEAYQQAESAAAQKPAGQPAQPAQSSGRQVVRTGTLNGRKVVQYSDGTTEYAQ